MKNYILLAFVFFTIDSVAQISPDPGNLSDGNSVNQVYALKFGPTSPSSATGECITSARKNTTIYGNLNGLDLITNHTFRMRIFNNGNIGIGTHANPTTRLSFGPYGGQTMRLSIFDTWDATNSLPGIRFGLGYFEEAAGTATHKRVFSFHVGEPAKSRFGFFDDYLNNGTNGYEFVTFNAANRSVGINNTAPTAKLHVYNPGDVSEVLRLESLYSSSPAVVTKSFVVRNSGNEVILDALTSSGTAPTLCLNKYGAGNVALGYFGSTGPGSGILMNSQSRFHLQSGNIQVTNSGAPVLGKVGITLGAFGGGNETVNSLTDYSWLQSSSGPLVLNPLSGNDMNTASNTYRYVAIGYTPSGALASTMAGYNLLVGGKVMCEELKIKLKTAANWPDYVFASDYKLMSLDSLSTYIDANCHLPNVPSAQEVEENGIMTGEMNGLLLKKVEELTLYVIEQNKTSATQAEQIELLKKQNELLMQQVQLLVQNNKN